MLQVEIVDQQRIDRGQAESRQAVLIGAQHAVAAVVEAQIERQAAGPARLGEGRGIGRPAVDAADLGAQHEAVARLGAEHAADPMLALAVAVPGRGVEIADAGGIGRLDREVGLRLVDHLDRIAERAAAKAEARDRESGLAQPARLERVHPRQAYIRITPLPVVWVSNSR